MSHAYCYADCNYASQIVNYCQKSFIAFVPGRRFFFLCCRRQTLAALVLGCLFVIGGSGWSNNKHILVLVSSNLLIAPVAPGAYPGA
jgi:hypothetical protein